MQGVTAVPVHLSVLAVVAPALDVSWISHQENCQNLPSAEWKHRWLPFCIYYKVNKLQLGNQELSVGRIFLLLWWCRASQKGAAFPCNKFHQYITYRRWTRVQHLSCKSSSHIPACQQSSAEVTVVQAYSKKTFSSALLEGLKTVVTICEGSDGLNAGDNLYHAGWQRGVLFASPGVGSSSPALSLVGDFSKMLHVWWYLSSVLRVIAVLWGSTCLNGVTWQRSYKLTSLQQLIPVPECPYVQTLQRVRRIEYLSS